LGFAVGRRYEDAIECYQNVPQGDSDSRQAISEKIAHLLYLKGDRDPAVERYQELQRQGYTDALLGLGEALDDMGHPDRALNVYADFMAMHQEDRNLAIAHVKKSSALAHLGRHKEALAEYKRALRYAPRDLMILVHQGVELGQALDVDAGIAELSTVVNEHENSDSLPFARLQLGLLLETKNRWKEAIVEYQKATELQPNYVEAYHKLGHALVHERQRSKAFEAYKKVAQLSPSDLERGYSDIFAYQWLASELQKIGDYPGAAGAYQAAIQIKSDDSAAHCQLALIDTSQDHLLQAVHEYGAALVPARIQAFNDDECMATLDHVLDAVIAGHRARYVTRAAVEIRKIRQENKSNQQSVAKRGIQGHTGGEAVEQARLTGTGA